MKYFNTDLTIFDTSHNKYSTIIPSFFTCIAPHQRIVCSFRFPSLALVKNTIILTVEILSF